MLIFPQKMLERQGLQKFDGESIDPRSATKEAKRRPAGPVPGHDT